jgi:hypothetical protein
MIVSDSKINHKVIKTGEAKLHDMSSGAWKAFGRTYPKLSLGMKEIIDNAISALLSRHLHNTEQMNIYIKIREVSLVEAKNEGFPKVERENSKYGIIPPKPNQLGIRSSYFIIEIHDNGCGIDDFAKALRIGKGEEGDNHSYLNEHGVGLKHALSFANIENDAWEIISRNEDDLNNNQYKVISAPFCDNMKYQICNELSWTSEYNGTGTVIRFLTTKEVYLTIGSTIEEGQMDTLEVTNNFIEDISVTYNKFLAGECETKNNKVNIEIEFLSHEGVISKRKVTPRYPIFEKIIKNGYIIKLNDDEQKYIGNVNITEGFIIENIENKYFYRSNLKSPRVYIYLNGRLIGNMWDNLFKEKNHNRFNKYYLEVNISIEDKNFIPSTNATKTHFSADDKNFKIIMQHIKENVLAPKSYEENLSEKERKEKYKEKIIKNSEENHIQSLTVIDEYSEAIDELGKTDLFVHYTTINEDGSQGEVKSELYEFKKGSLTLMSVFQLIGYSMYMHFEDYSIKEALLVVENKSFLKSGDPNSKDYEKSKKLKNFLKRFQEKFSIKISIKTYAELGIPTKVKKL